MAVIPPVQVTIEAEVIERLAEVVSEFKDAVTKFEAALADPEHRKMLARLTDERFRTVTR